MKRLFLLIIPLAASGAISTPVVDLTWQQAKITYSGMSNPTTACLVEISTSRTYSPLADDVNATLFSGANHDSRPGTIGSGTGQRTFVFGTRGIAQTASDGFHHSRSGGEEITYYGRINNDSACDSGGPVTFIFTLVTYPMGKTYNDPIPADPTIPGTTAYPDTGASNNVVIDPQSGLQMVPVSVPGTQSAHSGTVNFQPPQDSTNTWNCTTGALPCTYNSTNQAKLFLPIFLGSGVLVPSFENMTRSFLDFLQASLPCTATGSNVTVNVAIAVDGGTPLGTPQQFNCTTGGVTATVPATKGTTPPLTLGWGPLPGFHYKKAATRPWAGQDTNTVTTSGSVITWGGTNTSGEGRFMPPYAAGTPIILTGGTCTNVAFFTSGAASDTDSQLTVVGTPNSSCGTNFFTYSLTSFGLLIWASTNASSHFTIGSAANFTYQADDEPSEDSSPMQLFSNQSDGPMITVNGCPGWVAYHWGVFYWESAKCRQVNMLGQFQINGNAGVWPAQNIPDGTAAGAGACVFSATVAGRFFCGLDLFGNDTALVQVDYSNGGSWAANPPNTTVVGTAGNTSCSPTPCLNVTLLESSILNKAIAFSSNFAKGTYVGNPVIYGGCPDSTLMIQIQEAGQGTAGSIMIYDPSSSSIVALRPSMSGPYAVYGMAFHSVQPACAIVGGVRYVQFGAQAGTPGEEGALSGFDSTPGVGPARQRVPAGIGAGTVACPSWPGSGGTKVAQQDWPNNSNNPGNTCKSITLAANIWEDPSPYQATATITVPTGGGVSGAITSSGAFLPSDVGKQFVISGSSYTGATYTDASHMTVAPNVTAATGSYANSPINREPPCSFTGNTCDVSTDFAIRAPASGDKVYTGQPTTGITGYAGYLQNGQSSNTEGYLLLANTSGSTWTVQCNYGGLQTGCASWGTNTYLYLDGANNQYFGPNGSFNWNIAWNTTNDPIGANGLDLIDYLDFSEHGNRQANEWTIGTNTPTNPGLPTTVPTSTRWDGAAFTQNYLTRLGTGFSYFSQPKFGSIMNAPFNGIMGLGDPTDSSVDEHIGFPYVSATPIVAGGRPMAGWGNNTTTGVLCSVSHACGSVTTGTLYRFAPTTGRAFANGAAAITADKTMPFMVKCGTAPVLNISGPSAVIDGTSASWFKYVAVVNAGEGVSGSAAGEVYINCPGASIPGPNPSAPVTTDRSFGNQIDIVTVPSGSTTNGFDLLDVTRADSTTGSNFQNIGHCGFQYQWWNSFSNVRFTPDGLATLAQCIGWNNAQSTQVIMTILPSRLYDSVVRSVFIPIPISVSAVSGYTFAQVEFGYLENGAMGYCTPRAEACESSTNYLSSGDPFYYASQTQAPTNCASNCVITVPALSGRMLYYRVRRTDSSGTTLAASGWSVVPVP